MPLLEQIGVSNNIDGVVMHNAKTKGSHFDDPYFSFSPPKAQNKSATTQHDKMGDDSILFVLCCRRLCCDLSQVSKDRYKRLVRRVPVGNSS